MVGATHPWCDGYRDYYGNSIYNPRSVSNALSDGLCQSYWTATGLMDETSWYISNNVEAVRDDVVEMVAGNAVRIRFQEYYGAERMQLRTRSDILSAMVVYGFLTY